MNLQVDFYKTIHHAGLAVSVIVRLTSTVYNRVINIITSYLWRVFSTKLDAI